ncbi:ABC transporter permease [Euzebya sp.]|uniref:ABC transporter permease n=1 Tax=Euzebya sp. TaxID=1971409 RepID=UPI0035126BFF
MTTTTDVLRRRPPLLRLLRTEVADELKQIAREPAALFFSVLMPVGFFALFVSMFGAEGSDGDLPAGTVMLARFGSYGVIGAVMMNPGLALAEARDRGWFQAQKVSPVPIPVTLAARVLAALPFSIGILIAMTGAAAGFGVLEVTPAEWVALVASLVVGSLPFALVGLAIGVLAAPQAAAAIMNAVIIPLAIAGGLWFPLEVMPTFVADLAPALPTYHLAQLGMAALTGEAAMAHWAYLVAFTAVAGTLAAMAYRRAPT